MLPLPLSDEFPSALKARREALGLSRSELARRAEIHGVMPRRYEDPDCGEFARPREDTWIALNRALGYEVEAATLPAVRPLSIAEAKAGLAQMFGVEVDRIEITIRG